MGLSPYRTPADAGVLCIILFNTAISISIVKEIFRSIIHVVSMRITSWEEYSTETSTNSIGCRRNPLEAYVEEFRSRTPTRRYDSMHSCNPHEQKCSVCLTEFRPDALINYLSCGHVFHNLCLEKWLKYWNVTCPLCRNHVMPRQGKEDTCPM